MRNSSVLKRPLLRSGSVRSGGYSFLGSGAGGGEVDFLGEDDGETTGDLRRTRRDLSFSAAVARGRRSPARRPEKASASADAPAARRRCVAATALPEPPAAARWSAVAPSVPDARAASDGATDRTYASTAVLP
uniref:Uncharacterized protein n=1 Tax=Arundo donax TaxID=35708 RepID=A0A0A9EV44_ARUDO